MTALYSIQTLWGPRVEAPDAIGAKFLRVLDEFTAVDPALSHWGTINPGDESGAGRPIEPLRQEFAAFVAANVQRDDWGRPSPKLGYQLLAVNGYSPSATPTAHSASTRIRAGSNWKNEGWFEVGSPFTPPDPDYVTYSLFRRVMEPMISIWAPDWACAICSVWGAKPDEASGDPTFPYSRYQMPWIGYLNAERAKGVSPPPSLSPTRTADGGLLMSAADTRLVPGDGGQMGRSKVLAQIMIAHAGDL
jgi:hypothetical protein